MNQLKTTYEKLETKKLIEENKELIKRTKTPSLLGCVMCFKVLSNKAFIFKIEKENIDEERIYCDSCFKELKEILKSLNFSI